MPSDPWYVEAFRGEYRDVYSHRDLASARAEVAFLLGMGVAGRVLDLCCGFARHSLALREAGIEAYGLDQSAELLQQASSLPGGSRLAGRLIRGDARALPFRARSFDVVVVLFSSFGYFGAEGDRCMLGEIGRVTAEGGFAVLDLMNPARVRAQLEARSERELATGTLVEERRIEEGGRLVVKDVRLIRGDGTQKRWSERVRMYEREEIDILARALGLVVTDAYGSFRGETHESGSERMLLVLRRG